MAIIEVLSSIINVVLGHELISWLFY